MSNCSGQITADIAIIGAGIIGSAIAARAARLGFSVVVVDRLSSAGGGSTSASAGIVRVHAEDVPSALLASQALNDAWMHWRDFAEVPSQNPAAQFRVCGSLILDATSDFAHRIRQVMTDAKVDFELLDHDQLAQGWPDLDLTRFGGPFAIDDPAFFGLDTAETGADETSAADTSTGDPSATDTSTASTSSTNPSAAPPVLDSAIYTAASGYVADPMLAAQNLLDCAISHGAQFIRGRQVVAICTSRDAVSGLRLDDGSRLTCGVVINAAGPNSSQINALAGADQDFCVRTTAIREELHHVPVGRPMSLTTRGVHLVDGDLGTNFRTDDDALLIGSNGAACDLLEPISDPDDFDERPSRDGWDRSTLRAARRVPDLAIPNRRQGLAGVYDATDDWLPIYDQTSLRGFFVAMGTSGNQFKTAPVVAELMMQLVGEAMNGRDLDTNPLNFESFAQATIDTAFFSRLRTPHEIKGRG